MVSLTLSAMVWLVAGQFLLYALGWGLFSLLLKGERRAVAHWGVFMLLTGVGFLLAAQRGEPRTWLAYVGSNICWISGYVSLRRGLECFHRLPVRDAEHLVTLGIIVLAFAVVGPEVERSAWRVVLAYGGGAWIMVRVLLVVNSATRREFGLRTSIALGVPALLMIAMFSVRTLEQLIDPTRVLEMQNVTASNRNMLFGYLAGAAMFNFSFMGLVTMRLVRRLSEQARLDPLTGLPNRRAFEELFAGEWGRLRRGGPGFAVLALDLDHFKRINDAHGHLVGDAVLAQTAQRLRQAARQIDTVARTGGEEFIVLVPQADQQGAFSAAERLRLAVRSEAFTTVRGDLSVTLSIGVAIARADEGDPRTVLQRADRALYDAKTAGRDVTRVAGG